MTPEQSAAPRCRPFVSIFVAARSTATACLLEFPAFRAHVRLRVVSAGRSEVFLRLPVRLGTTQQERVFAQRRLERQLIEGEARTTCLDDPRTCSGSEAERADFHLRDLEEAHVVCDAADNDGCFAVSA